MTDPIVLEVAVPGGLSPAAAAASSAAIASAATAAGQAANAAASATGAAASKSAADADVASTHADVVSTHADVVSTHADAASTASDRTAVHADRLAADADAAQTAVDRAAASTSASASAASASSAAASAGAASTSAGGASTSASAASASASSTAALLASFRGVFLGAFANDGAAIAFASANSITISAGVMYENTTSTKFCIYSGSAWGDYDASAQAQQAAAALSAANAASSASAAATSATGAAASKTAADADAIATAADRVQTGLDRASTTSSAAAASGSATAAAGSAAAASGSAATSTTQATAAAASVAQIAGYSTAAQSANVNAQTVSGLSNLSNAARATLISTTVVVTAAYDARRDTDGGAWTRKVPLNSYVTETLNTTTRGAVPQYPSRTILIGQTATLSVQNNDDPAGPIWKSWTVAGLLGVAGMNGYIAYSGTGGYYVIDLILDQVFKHDTSGTWLASQNVATYNQSTVTWTLITAVGAIINNATGDTDMYVVPLTPLNSLRLNLPNPTMAVTTGGNVNGVAVIRFDGVVCGASTQYNATNLMFDEYGDLVMWSSGPGPMTVATPAQYLSPSFTSLLIYYYSTLPTYSNFPFAKGKSAFTCSAANGYLAIFKRNRANIANSMLALVTSTYNTGFMPGAGQNPILCKVALAESSADGSSLLVGASPINDTFGTDPGGYLVSGSAAPTSVSGGAMTVTFAPAYVYKPMTTIIGRAYRVRVTISAFSGGTTFYFGASNNPGASWVNYRSFTPAVGSYDIAFVATATTTNLTMTTGTSGTITFTSIGCDLIAADRTAASNTIGVTGNGPIVNGTVTRTAVATGADLYAYGGFSASNFLEGTVGAIDPAVGDMCYAVWVNWTSGTSQVVSRAYWSGSAWSGAAEQIAITSSNLTFYSTTNGFSSQDAVSKGSAIAAGVWNFIVGVRRGNTLELYLNGVKINTITMVNSTASHTNANATLRVGNQQDNTAAINGNIALPRVSLFAPSQDQIAAMYAAELPLFQPNAKCLLSGATPTAIAYDPETDQLAVSNSTAGTDVFKGLARVSNQRSTTATNLCVGSAVPSSFTYSGASLGSKIAGPSAWGNGEAWQLLDTAVNTYHYFYTQARAYANGTTYTFAQPFFAGTVGFVEIVIGSAYVVLNLSTGALSTSGGGAAAGGAVSMGGGWWLVYMQQSSFSGSQAFTVEASNAGTSAGNSYLGSGGVALSFGKPIIYQGSAIPTVASYVADGLSNNDNHKAVAFSGGDLVIGTAAGVDSILASAPGLRETAKGRKPVPVYDPTWGTFLGVTTDATPTVFASIPIPEGKGYRFRCTIAAEMYGGTATEKAVYDITGIVTRDIGGNVVVVSTTTTVSEVTAAMDCVAQANTTAQTLEIKGTGKAATRIAWFDGQELYDIGLQQAA